MRELGVFGKSELSCERLTMVKEEVLEISFVYLLSGSYIIYDFRSFESYNWILLILLIELIISKTHSDDEQSFTSKSFKSIKIYLLV